MYPRKGYTPTEERIKELSTSANKRGVPVIVKIDDIKPVKAVKEEKAADTSTDFMNPPIEADNEEKPVKKKGKGKKNA